MHVEHNLLEFIHKEITSKEIVILLRQVQAYYAINRVDVDILAQKQMLEIFSHCLQKPVMILHFATITINNVIQFILCPPS